jgi:TonB-linked SusC/RagA family outer membrane protein
MKELSKKHCFKKTKTANILHHMKNKISLLFILFCLASYASASTLSTFLQITIDLKNVNVERVLNEIEVKTEYRFVYKVNDVDLNRTISIKIDDDIIKVLSELFRNTDTTFRIDGNHVFLNKKSKQEKAVQDYIKGTIKDQMGVPLMGVSIYFENSITGTVSDENGNFRLEKDQFLNILIFKSIGYITQKVEVNDQRNFNIILQEEVTELNAVLLVVNTGISKRDIKSFTGAATTISGEQLKQISTNNVFSAIGAIDPSFRILPNNISGGDINTLPNINIRGTSSFPNLTGELSADPNTPLFILDGFQVEIERIYDLDINLIQSITILKDASATAIYGSRGANGVMVFTTIFPKAGKLRITVNNSFNVLSPNLSGYNYLNSTEKLDFEKRVGIYTFGSPDLQYVYDVLYNERLKAATSGVNTDWAKIPVQTGYGNQTSLYIQGGDEVIRYGAQVSADFKNGVMKGQNRDNYSGQFDFSYQQDKFRFSNSIRVFQNIANASPYGNFSEYLNLNPYWSPYDENGNPKKYLESYRIANRIFEQTNILYDASLNSLNKVEYFGFSNNFQFRYDIAPYLFAESSLSINKRNTQADEFYSAENSRFNEIVDVNQKGSYTVTNTNTTYFESLTTLNLNIVKGKNQLFSMLGFNFSNNSVDYYRIVTQGFPYDKLDNLLFAAQYEENGIPSGEESTVRSVGLVYSGNYSYNDRFLFDVSFRRDGSSQYGSDNRYGLFWSGGLGWNIHNESIFKDKDWINRLKLRASYGSTGSTNIPAYGAQTRYSYGVSTLYDGQIGTTLINLGNSTLSWQNVYKLNTGVDMELLNNKLSARFDYYIEDTKDALTQVTLPGSSGFQSFSENLGEIRNQGFEFALKYKLLENKTKRMFWSVNVSGYTNKNILKKLSNKLKSANDNLNDLNEAQTIPNVLFQEGESTNTLYVVPSLGIDPMTGSEIFLKKDGTTTYTWDAKDKVAFGVTDPKWNGIFGTNFMLYGFEFGMVFNYRFGGQIYNQTLVDRVESVNPAYNVDRRAYDLGWLEPGDISNFTRITTSKVPTKLTSRFVQDEDFVNLTSVSLAYNLDSHGNLLKKLGMNACKLTFLSNDVLTWSSIDIERGTSNPFARTYSLSLRANF